VKTQKPSAARLLILAHWFERWGSVFQAQRITKELIDVYAEALSDLSPEQLETGCCEVTRSALQFPKPAEIRAALRRVEGLACTRPKYLDEPIPPESERWTVEARADSDKVRAKLGLPPSESSPDAKVESEEASKKEKS